MSIVFRKQINHFLSLKKFTGDVSFKVKLKVLLFFLLNNHLLDLEYFLVFYGVL